MENIEFDSIMKEITSGLTGDAKADLAYIMEQGEKYRSHKYAKEITRACGRIMYSLLPEDKKEELAAAIERDNMGYEAALEEIHFKMYRKEFPEALKLMEAIVDKYENSGMFIDDDVSEYHNFKELMEELLYVHLHDVTKKIRHAGVDFSDIYLLYGNLLYELNRHEDAIAALEKAMKWNPSSAKIAFEHAENYKALRDFDAFEACTREIYKIAFKPSQLAHYYRNLGYLYVEKKEYEVAAYCELYSMEFESSNIAQSELYNISSITGKIYSPDFEKIEACLEKFDIPLGPSEDVFKIAHVYGNHFKEEGDYEAAIYCFEIIQAFLEDEKLGQTIEELKCQLEESDN